MLQQQQQRFSCRARIYYFRQHVGRRKKKKEKEKLTDRQKKELTGQRCSIESYGQAAQQQQ